MAMEASLFSSGKSNAGSSATQNNGDDWKQQTTALGHKTHGADHGHRSVDDSSFLFGEEWEVIDESGNSLSRDDNPSPRFAGIVPETRTGTKEADRVTRKWEDAGKTHGFSVRGQTYLTDKGKRPAGPAMCRLVGVDCFAESSLGVTRIDHIASRGRCRARVEELTSGDDPPFLFIMNIQVRGTPTVSLVVYWAIERTALSEGGGGGQRGTRGMEDSTAHVNGLEGTSVTQEAGFSEIFLRYANIPLSSFGGDSCSMMDPAPPRPSSDERNQRFKLIPRVISGPWMMRKAIGSTPVLLGTKIYHRYYRGENYVETDLDTGSSTAAATLCGRCRWYSRNLNVEVGIVLQANASKELPEALLGAVRLNGFGVEDPDLQQRLYTR